MSQENVEIVRAVFEAWNAGDMDALRELYDPDVIVRTPEGWPEPGPFVGREAVMRQFEQLRETWDADALELISDFIDAGDRVAVRFIWRGAGHGPESNMELTGVYTVRKGRIVCHGVLLGSRGGPRSRGAVGVGDVAGERGDRASRIRGPGSRLCSRVAIGCNRRTCLVFDRQPREEAAWYSGEGSAVAAMLDALPHGSRGLRRRERQQQREHDRDDEHHRNRNQARGRRRHDFARSMRTRAAHSVHRP